MAEEEDNEVSQHLATFSKDERILALLEACVGRVLRNLRRARRNWIEAAFEVDVKHVVDWLEIAVMHGEPWLEKVDQHGRPKKLLKFATLSDIVKEANKASAVMAQKLKVRRIKDGDEQLEHDFGTGWYMVRLLTPEALDNESAVMQHCVGHGTYDAAVVSRRTAIYSLRDPSNAPHATVEVDVDADAVQQIRGKQNERPVPKYARMLRAWLIVRDFETVYRANEIGLVKDDMGVTHDVDRLHAGMWFKRLDLSGQDLSELPEDLTVRGDLVVEGTQITRLPKGLKVTGRLKAARSSLEGIELDHGIGGSMDLSGTRIEVLPDGLRVYGDLNVSGTRLRRLPTDMVVTGSITMRACLVSMVPDDAVVGKSIDIRESRLKSLPNAFRHVGGSLIWEDMGPVSVPEVLAVEGNLVIRGTQFEHGWRRVDVGGRCYHSAGERPRGSGDLVVRGLYYITASGERIR